jgi:mono/diheme cytochrome c family protein
MFAYLRTLPAVRSENLEHSLRFPYDQRWLLAAWRLLYFRPGVYEGDASRSSEWNRGAYLAEGLAHCSACHEARNSLGAIRSQTRAPAGGLVLDWYAPSFASPREAGVQQWSEARIVALLKHGIAGAPDSARRASAMGPMAEVVFESLQHVPDEELRAVAVYLRSIPESGSSARGLPHVASPAELASGRRVYAEHCTDCHGDDGEGRAPAAPALADNRAVTLATPINPIRIVLYGGFPPGTAGNPRPFGMPPFAQSLSDEQIGDVLTYVRASWGNATFAVTADEVRAQRTGPLW